MIFARRLSAIAAICVLGFVAGCGEKSEPAPTTTPSAANCAPSKLETQAKGVLTVATSDPAYPPYVEHNDPTNGQGFESAVAYAIGKQLGFSTNDVKWVTEDFNASYAPGPKDFDFDLNQISITPARAKQVDFSAPYYTANQAVVALDGTPAAKATTLADLKDAQIGVQIGTTSLDAAKNEIQPTTEPKVFDTSNDVVTALKQGQVDAIVVDLPTALIITATQVQKASVIGQFPASGGNPDQFGALLQKNSSLTPCITLAINDLKKSGELKQITDRWMSQSADVPKLTQ